MCGRAYTSVRINPPQPMRKYGPFLFCHIITPSFFFQETYLMKHMSKHTVVEHLVSHHSPQRTESPSIPIRISLIWASSLMFLFHYKVFCSLRWSSVKKKNIISVKRPRRTFESDIVFAPLALSDIKPTGHWLNNCCLNWMARFNSRHQSKGF